MSVVNFVCGFFGRGWSRRRIQNSRKIESEKAAPSPLKNTQNENSRIHLKEDLPRSSSLTTSQPSSSTHPIAVLSTENISQASDESFNPPQGPPPPPLKEVDFPLILPEHVYNLSGQGWTTVTLSNPSGNNTIVPSPCTGPDLQDALNGLFVAAQQFFAQPVAYKNKFLSKVGSEDGYNSIPGEKEFITVRTLDRTPPELKVAVPAVWTYLGALLTANLAKVAESLDIPEQSLTKFAKPCDKLHDYTQTASMLRVFKYEMTNDHWEDVSIADSMMTDDEIQGLPKARHNHQRGKIVAEPHSDLGLLSFVYGDSPGLEVWNTMTQSFYPIEKNYDNQRSKATLLVGRQLYELSNGKYLAGGHQVRSYEPSDPNILSHLGRWTTSWNTSKPPRSPEDSYGCGKHKKFRYSIVFVLRAHYPIVIDVASLTSNITGKNTMITDGETAGDMFKRIRKDRYNINSNMKERDKQKKIIAETKRSHSQ